MVAGLAVGTGLEHDDRILVLTPSGTRTLPEGATVRVTGLVRDAVSEAGLRTSQDLDDFDVANVLVATAIERLDDDAESATDFDELVSGERAEGGTVSVVGEVADDDVGDAGFLLRESG
jgi:hypothetical protein